MPIMARSSGCPQPHRAEHTPALPFPLWHRLVQDCQLDLPLALRVAQAINDVVGPASLPAVKKLLEPDLAPEAYQVKVS